jgi:hypothetical protein
MLIQTDTHSTKRINQTYDDTPIEVEVREIHIPDRSGLTVSRNGTDYNVVKLVRTITHSEDEHGNVIGTERYHPHHVTLRPVGNLDESEDTTLEVKVGNIWDDLGRDLDEAFPGVL